jgi:hypothetical protein
MRLGFDPVIGHNAAVLVGTERGFLLQHETVLLRFRVARFEDCHQRPALAVKGGVGSRTPKGPEATGGVSGNANVCAQSGPHTQLPLPSHVEPPLELQGAPKNLKVCAGVPAMQTSVVQSFPSSSGTSASSF